MSEIEPKQQRILQYADVWKKVKHREGKSKGIAIWFPPKEYAFTNVIIPVKTSPKSPKKYKMLSFVQKT